jgi:hypothetical protein
MTPILPDIAKEARRLLDAIADEGIDARLIGGMAIRMLAGERLHPAFEREIVDLDFVVAKRQEHRLGLLLQASGYLPDEEFNALNGARRMLFHDIAHGRQIDVFVGRFVMCHELPVARRLTHRADTLPATEVLMTKLQIVSLTEKDRGDLYALLDSHEVAGDDERAIDPELLAALASEDWGLQHTFELNLGRLREGLPALSIPPDAIASVARRIDRIEAAMQSAPKSRKWRLRARIGERKQWYEEPEEVDREA